MKKNFFGTFHFKSSFLGLEFKEKTKKTEVVATGYYISISLKLSLIVRKILVTDASRSSHCLNMILGMF